MALSVIMGSSPLGEFGLLWSLDKKKIPKVSRIVLSRPGRTAEQIIAKLDSKTVQSSCRTMICIVQQITAFLEGTDVAFDLADVCLDCCPPFQRKVLIAEYHVSRGRVTTYQRLARHTGKPSGARAVGNALAANPFPILIPCHRAVRSDLSLGGFQGGLQMKRILLENEGQTVDRNMCLVDPKMVY